MSQLKYLQRVLRTVFPYIEKTVALIGAIILMLWLIDPLRTYLINNLHISPETIITIIGILIFVFWRLFVEFDITLGSLSLKVNDIATAATKDNLITGGVHDVYGKIDDVIKEHLNKPRAATHKYTYDVLGLTLFTAWQNIHKYLINPTFSGWDIRLYCLSPDFIQSNKGTILPDWLDEVNRKIPEIQGFMQRHEKALNSRNLSLSLVTYNHFPAVHGFRINDKDLFFTIVDWRLSDNLLSEPVEPQQFYQFVSASNTTRSAHLYHLLFNSWIERAARTGNKIL